MAYFSVCGGLHDLHNCVLARAAAGERENMQRVTLFEENTQEPGNISGNVAHVLM